MAKEGEAGYTTNVFLERLVNDQKGQCETLWAMSKLSVQRLWWVTGELLHAEEKLDILHKDLGSEGLLHKDLAQLHSDLTVKGGLSVAVASLPELTAGSKAIGTVKVTESPPDTFVQSAIVQDSETLNQGLWGLAGLFVGGLLLYVFYKVVRP